MVLLLYSAMDLHIYYWTITVSEYYRYSTLVLKPLYVFSLSDTKNGEHLCLEMNPVLLI